MERRLAGLLLLSLLNTPATAETLAGPVAATVERVVDGDTLAVKAQVWLGQEIRVLVRLRGIDAPELKGRCAEERQRAEAAAHRLAGLLSVPDVILRHIEGDKYFGRVIADVGLVDGRDLAQALAGEGLARAYDGGTRSGWCTAEMPAAPLSGPAGAAPSG